MADVWLVGCVCDGGGFHMQNGTLAAEKSGLRSKSLAWIT